MNGLYEEGSNKIYTENNKNIYNSKMDRYSEHFGHIIEKSYKIEKINIISKNRVDKDDPEIYLPPKVNLETFDMKYIFHTHPLGFDYGLSRDYEKYYEFPSRSDIGHYIDCHNFGVLQGSIVISPEGLYLIRKYNFNKNKIKIDFNIFYKRIEKVIMDIDNISEKKYNDIFNNRKNSKKNFYNKVSNNIEFIKMYNEELEKYDIAIDYYSRILFKDTGKYLLPNIYLPII